VKNVLPRYSIANGYDFGNPEALGLPALSVAEQMLIAWCHPYKRILKLVGGQEALSGHTVCLEHDGSHVLAPSLPRLSLGDQLVVAFVGTEEQWRRATGLGMSDRAARQALLAQRNVRRATCDLDVLRASWPEKSVPHAERVATQIRTSAGSQRAAPSCLCGDRSNGLLDARATLVVREA